MSKNERLMDILGDVSPIFVKEAAPTNMPRKDEQSTAHYIYLRKRSVVAMAACMVMAMMMMFVFGFSASALTPDHPVDTTPDHPVDTQQTAGTLLTGIPQMLTAQDYEQLTAVLAYNLEGEPNGEQIYKRCTAFYLGYAPKKANNEAAREKILEIYPITKVTDVYVLEEELLASEENAILYWLMYYGGMSQEKLIATYQSLYDAVDASTLSEEEKTAIKATLPEIPTLHNGVPEVDMETILTLAKEKGKRLPSPADVPMILTEADYTALVSRMLEKAGVERVEDAPYSVQRTLAFYLKYDLNDEVSRPGEAGVKPLLQLGTFYVMTYDVTLFERSYLSASMAYYGDIWSDEALQLKNNCYAAIDASDAWNKDSLHQIVDRILDVIRETQ